MGPAKNSHIDSIVIGDNVWVTQGKTDHMATYFGAPRTVVVYSDLDKEGNGNKDDSNTSNAKGKTGGHTEELNVLIRWATTGMKSYVSAGSVRSVVSGQRRRRQVVNHYQAIPSMRPTGNNVQKQKKPRKKKVVVLPKQEEKEPKAPPEALEVAEDPQTHSEDREENMPREDQKKKESNHEKQQQKQPPPDPEQRRAGKNDNDKDHDKDAKDTTEPSISHKINSGPPSDETRKKFKFKLPTKEEFQKYQEQKQREKEKKERHKDKEIENSLVDTDSESEKANANTNTNANGDTVDATATESDNEALISDDSEPKPITCDSGALNSTATSEAQDFAKEPQSTVSSPTGKSPFARRISASDGGGGDESVGLGVDAAIEIGEPGDLEDPDHTIDRGFQWEWENPETAHSKKSKNSITTTSESNNKPVPGNYGKRQPQSWDEAYAMIETFRRTRAGDIPSDHPLLGEFVVALRREYSRFRKRARKKPRRSRDSTEMIENIDTVYGRAANHHRKNSRTDMTRLNSNRVNKLKKIGFKWHDAKQFESDIGTPSSAGKANNAFFDSETETSLSAIDFDNESNNKNSVSSLDDSMDEGGNDLEDDGSYKRRKRRKLTNKSWERSKSYTPSLLSSPFNDDEHYDKDLNNSHIDDHANDDEFLIVSDLKAIALGDSTLRNKKLFEAGRPTLSIQLYRMLRLSTVHRKLGLNKIVRWTDDGNGFRILDDSRFTKHILSKTSRIQRSSSFRNALFRLNFELTRYGRNQSGRNYYFFRHKSIADAEEANDPSLRLFYRGAPFDVMWSIKTRKEERDETGVTKEKQVRPKKKNKDYDIEELRDRNRERRGREIERRSRRTSDGCLLPKCGTAALLLDDATYDKPRGAKPNGLMWDRFRGIWAPPHLLTKEPSKDTPPSKRSRMHSMGSHHDNSTTDRDQEHLSFKRSNMERWASDNIKGRSMSARRTSDGCLLPKHDTAQYKDGTYKRPKGHTPVNMEWDAIRGLWAPIGKTQRALGSSMSSFSEDDAMIIKASKAKLLHHSSFLLRTYFQPKKRSRRHHSSYHSHHFQARTKGNPSGIVKHTINLSNWRKIEKLMQRSTQQKNIAVPAATSNAFSSEGEECLI